MLRKDLENAAILKDLVHTAGESKQKYHEIVNILSEKLLASLKEDPTIEVRVPDHLIDEIRKEIGRELEKQSI